MAVKRICEGILGDEKCITPVSSMMHGEYGIEDVCLSTLSTVNNKGIRNKVVLPLNDEEIALLHNSADKLKEIINSVNF